jgi:hypothetical protein
VAELLNLSLSGMDYAFNKFVESVIKNALKNNDRRQDSIKNKMKGVGKNNEYY